jgi:CDP-glucose 4,6-dehydratase
MKEQLDLLKTQLDGPVLITGHTGFKGSWLTLLLERLGVEVVGYSLPPSSESLYMKLRNSKGPVIETFSDVRDLNALKAFIKKTQPSVIFHLAAQPLVNESYLQPYDTFETNVMGTVNLFEAAPVSKKIKNIIVITTDKVYKNSNLGFAFKETDELQGHDPYSTSKVAAESAVLAWQNLSKLNDGPQIFTARAGNVIGGGDWTLGRLIPDLVRGLYSDQIVTLRNPNSTRPWQHVLDPLIGYLLILVNASELKENTVFNFGPIEQSLSVTNVVDIVEKVWGNKLKIEFTAEKKFTEAKQLNLDSSLARKLLTWSPVWDQILAIEQTTNWWKKHLMQGQEALELCNNEIEFALTHNFNGKS